MSDQPTGPSAPPPPPESNPAPYLPPPPAGSYPPPGTYQPPGTPPPIMPMQGISPAAGAPGIISQFTGAAGWGVLLGIVTIVVPFVFNRVFFFLPIIGLLAGIQAIRSRKLIGGIVAIVLNLIGGIITLIALFGG